ncbi:DNA-binding transcriptional regulator, MerR family [Arthrobacter alpinus]|uniref:DNA-binding transcriptional regulator, MerR family n=1 Tax=Arthrobacter alpinus TaxID=656366 RepID=A0A1H5MKA9_9MICC|nr:MerR family transcriptional regulator [Arthrobacter alpinus]SEE89812.1 DNA-binding transcriptional regulator, MerR family [Arthrobacter alpinus]
MSTFEPGTDWSIHQITAVTGTTSRMLRHYAAIGLLPPSRIAGNGYRHYNQQALVRLQRILLLRELGLGLPEIASVLDRERSPAAALKAHVAWLRGEQDRLTRLIASVEKTIEAENEGEKIMAEDMFDGFDHTQHKEEVEQRWGKDAYARSDAWWQSMDATEQAAWKGRVASLGSDWIAAFTDGVSPDSPVAQELARRHVQWLASIPGTPASTPGGDIRGYVAGLAEMYVADPRFGANYGGTEGASFVRDVLGLYAEREL